MGYRGRLLRRHALYSCSIWSARSRSSQTRSSDRATKRFSGSTASYWGRRPLSIVSSPLPLERPLPLLWPALRFDLAQFSNRQSYPVWRQRLQDQPLNFSVDREQRSHLLAFWPPFGATVGNTGVDRILAVRSRVAQSHAGAAATADDPYSDALPLRGTLSLPVLYRLRLSTSCLRFARNSLRRLQGLVVLQNLYLANKLFGVLVSTNIVMFVST